jgi:hypothetical protein
MQTQEFVMTQKAKECTFAPQTNHGANKKLLDSILSQCDDDDNY